MPRLLLRPVRLLALVLVACRLTACSGGSSSRESSAPAATTPPAPEIALEELGVTWPEADPMDFAPAPKTPAGFDEDRFAQMVNTLRIWARANFIDETVRDADGPLVALKDKLGYEVGSITDLMRKEVGQRVSAANVFGDDVEVLGPPVTTTAWKVEEGRDDAKVTLQVHGLYRVRQDGGPERVIGVLRTNSIKGRRLAWEYGLVSSHAWQVFGTETCPLALEDAFVPAKDLAEAKKDLAELVKSGNRGKVRSKFLGEVRAVDAKTVARCEEKKA